MIDFARDGDTVMLHSLDWLARDLDEVRCIVSRFTARPQV
jgi:DNA invertase Pin-like site-specific DNA recombinase